MIETVFVITAQHEENCLVVKATSSKGALDCLEQLSSDGFVIVSITDGLGHELNMHDLRSPSLIQQNKVLDLRG